MKNFLNAVRRRHLFSRNRLEPADFIEVERAERLFYLKYIREGMTIFDAGANVGELTILFSRFAGESGFVHAFEASGEVFKNLEIVCRIAQRRNLKLNHLALADESKTIRLNVYDDALSALNSEADRPLKKYGIDAEPLGVEEIEATTVDRYCAENNIEKIDLLKIDVEGAELKVMHGARRMLAAHRIRCLTFEFGQTTFDMGVLPAEIENFLTGMNYKISNVIAGEPIFPGRESVETARYAMHFAEPI